MRAGISAVGTPCASSSPARRLRLCGASAVATRSPVPARPIIDSGRAPWRLGVAPDLGEDVAGRGAGGVEALGLGGAGGQRGGVLRRAGELDADRVVGQLADDAGADEDLRERAASASSAEAATSAAPSCTISRAWAGPPMHGHAVGAEVLAQQDASARVPSGGTSPLASETTPRARGEARVARARRSPRRARARGRRGRRSRRARARRSTGSIRSSRGSSTPGR